MIYPDNFETKIGFDKVKQLIIDRCLSPLGVEQVESIGFSNNFQIVIKTLEECREFRKIIESETEFPCSYFHDLRHALKRIKIEGTYIDTTELFELGRSLSTIISIVKYLSVSEEEETPLYPHLKSLTNDIPLYPNIVKEIDTIVDKYGRIKDNASPKLREIRSEINAKMGSISRSLNAIIRRAREDGYVESDVNPTIRDGRLVIPVNPSHKRKIRGIVHDESASGKTVFIEPAEIVEANNMIRELEAEEKREVIRILTEFTAQIRPLSDDMIYSYLFLGEVDFIRAKSLFAETVNGEVPVVEDCCQVDWFKAVHPLLYLSLKRQNRAVVPLDIRLEREGRILLISGPNAGGKSVCLKTLGLLQYMLQCGIPVPMNDNSRVGIFDDIFIDIGDEQSIEDDLSTYSSHLLNMKNFVKGCNSKSLLLIDEFGSGTEPRIGGAISESLLDRFNKRKAFGVITTHYQNLKQFAEDNKGVINGAMLYDRHKMQPLFKLSIGNPGSSFAIEIARKIGLPEDVINEASNIVGQEYVSMDKYLQDIVRDKQYWENKRYNIRQTEKKLEELTERYESDLNSINKERKEILRKAKDSATQIISSANARVENTIREIRETQAEKEKAKQLRKEMQHFKDSIAADSAEHDSITKKIDKINRRKKSKKSEEKSSEQLQKSSVVVGDAVKLKDSEAIGEVLSISGKNITVAFGMIKSTVKMDKLQIVSRKNLKKASTKSVFIGGDTIDNVRNKQLNFKSEIDLRGLRGDEAIEQVAAFIDTALLFSYPTLRILHGTGNGILKQLVRNYLRKIKRVKSFRDEDIQLGGAGITVVEL